MKDGGKNYNSYDEILQKQFTIQLSFYATNYFSIHLINSPVNTFLLLLLFSRNIIIQAINFILLAMNICCLACSLLVLLLSLSRYRK